MDNALNTTVAEKIAKLDALRLAAGWRMVEASRSGDWQIAAIEGEQVNRLADEIERLKAGR